MRSIYVYFEILDAIEICGVENKKVTGEVSGELSIAEPPSWFMIDEVSAIRWEVSFDKGLKIVIIASI